MATDKNAYKFSTYTFHAKAVAAHFRFIDAECDDFGPEFALAFHGRSPFRHKERTGEHKHPEIRFKRSWLHITATERRGVHTVVAKAGLKDLDVKGKVTADEIEAGIMAVYHEEWFGDSDRRKAPRILPLRPVIKNLKICGDAYRLGKELVLPDAFDFSDDRRTKYFAGEGPEIEPVGIYDAPGERKKSDCGEIAISRDTRRIDIPNFGIVTLADWKWLPCDIHTHERTVQWVELIGLDLKNPGTGGGSGAGGGGVPYGKGGGGK